MAAASKRPKTTIQRYVPPDLIREIFLYLPCKSLFRFRSACKLVNSFPLRDFQFMHEHINRNMKKTSHYLTWNTKDERKLHVFELSKDRYTHLKFLQFQEYRFASPSVYGLVCLHGSDSKSIALLNPLSGETFSLPDLTRSYSDETKNMGFGYDPKTDQYKIVQFVFSLSTQAISRCYVLTLSGGLEWRIIRVSENSMVRFMWQPVHVQGLLYWEIKVSEGELVRVFVFDLSTEEMWVIQSPARFRPDRFGSGKHLTLLEGELCCVDLSPPVGMSLTMTIWKHIIFSDDNAGWILSYKLDIYDSRPQIYALFPLYMDDDGKTIVCESFGDLYRYHLEKKTLQVYPVTQRIEGIACRPYSNISLVHSEKIISPIGLWSSTI